VPIALHLFGTGQRGGLAGQPPWALRLHCTTPKCAARKLRFLQANEFLRKLFAVWARSSSVLYQRSFNNIGFKRFQIINVTGAPTCFGTTLLFRNGDTSKNKRSAWNVYFILYDTLFLKLVFTSINVYWITFDNSAEMLLDIYAIIKTVQSQWNLTLLNSFL